MPTKDPEKVLTTPSEGSDKGKDSLVITAFQTACLAIIVLLAKFVGDLLYDAIMAKSITGLLIILILVSILNFFEIANNWVSIKTYFPQYDARLFSMDVLTLGVFFWQTYLLTKLNDTQELIGIALRSKMLLVIIASYGIIFFLYALWNFIILKRKDFQSNEGEKNSSEHQWS